MAKKCIGKKKYMSHLTINLFQFYKRLCTSVSEMIHSHVVQLYSVLVEVLQSLLAMKGTETLHHGLEMKSFPATTTFNMDDTVTAPTNKWIVWISDWEGEYVKAHKAVEGSNTVSFLVEEGLVIKAVKTYKLKDIKDYHIVE